MLLLASTALAVQPTPTPAIIIPTVTPRPLQTVVPQTDDARLTTCTAHTLPDFVPYVVQEGDTLAALLGDAAALTPTALAALNCLDDPGALPVGAVIWLPADGRMNGEATAEACAHAWIGGIDASPRCPDAPQIGFAVYQPFERGAMLWFSDTRQIYALTDDGRFTVYQDTFVEGQPDPTDAAPDGAFTPVRGFGRVWAALGGAEGPLGWGSAAETGFDAATQAAGRTSFTTYLLLPDDRVLALTEIPGLAQGFWVEVTAGE